MLADFRYALRMLVKSPAFAAVAVITLALGIGANTAIFTVINGVLLKSLAYPDPTQLVTWKAGQSVPDMDDVRQQNQSFTSIGGVGAQPADYTGSGEPVQFQLGLAAGDFFPVFGVRAALGRTLTAKDDRFGGPRVLVLSHVLWQRQFDGDPAIVGREITLAGQSYTVIGVLPADFHAPDPALEAFVPIRVFYPVAAHARGAHLLRLYGRLRPGMPIAQAQSDLRIIDKRLAEANPDENKNRETVLLSLQERMVGDIRPALLVLFGAVGLVLAIACANFANLLLVRIAQRTQELTVRAALGASRARLIGHVLTESILLAILGGLAGLLLGNWGVDALLALKPENLPRVENIHLDGRVLAFSCALSLLSGLLFGLFPARQATRVNAESILPSAGRSITAARSPLRSLLVVIELALAFILLIGAGLLGKTFWRLTSVSPGFDPAHVLVLRVELPEARYREIPGQTQFRERVLENMNSLRGVHAAMISELPLGGNSINHNFIIEGRPPIRVGEEPELYSRSIAGEYFEVLGIPVRQGRGLTSDDRANRPLVGVVNQAMARRYFPEGNAIGARLRWARDEGVNWITIVGVVGDVRHFGLAQAEEPAIYTPYAQSNQAWKRWSEIVVRTEPAIDRKTLPARLKETIWKVDPLVAIARMRAMTEVMSVSLAERRFNAILLSAFAGVALLLASVGLFGVFAFTVAQRTREIGIRMAVGAQKREVMRMILGQGLKLTLVGVALGVFIALASTRILAGFLYGVAPNDVPTFAALAFLLVGVALTACVIPARRAMRVDPAIALRYE